MSQRTARTVSRVILLVVVATVAANLLVIVFAGDRFASDRPVVVGDPNAPGMAQAEQTLLREAQPGDRFGEVGTADAVFTLVAGTVAIIWAVTGSLIVSRQPTNWAGWIFEVGAVSASVGAFSFPYVLYSVKVASNHLPGEAAVATIGEYALTFAALIPLLVLFFPDGHPPSARWRWVTRVLLAGFAIALVTYALTPGPLNSLVEGGILYANPIGLDAFAEGRPGNGLVALGTFMILGASLATVVAVWKRFRRSTGEERQQMRWLVATATFAGIGLAAILLFFPIGLILGANEESFPEWLWAVFFIPTVLSIFIGIPLAYLVAIFRYRLWDLDVVVKKTVAFGVVATGLTLLVMVALLALPATAVGSGLTGWEYGLLLVGVAIGLLFGPLRRLARRLADRIVYRKRATPYEVLTSFSDRMGETYSIEDVLPRMVQVLASGTGATSARVLLQVGTDVREVARWPDEPDPTGVEHIVPVVHLGEEMGALSVTMPANDPLNPSKDKLISDLAAQAGLVLRNVRLIEDLRGSRQRLVAAQDEERRKIERNLHDGAQQQLVALAVQLKLARAMIDRDPIKAGEMLNSLEGSASDALEDLRDLARGIYPPLLADRGLATALQTQARRSSVPVDVDAENVGRYPQDVEAAVYFCTLEALNNVAKYAQATHADVKLTRSNGTLVFEVRDDGVGFDASATTPGTGLQGMADRLEAIGGVFLVESSPGHGTTVTGRVPSSEAPH